MKKKQKQVCIALLLLSVSLIYLNQIYNLYPVNKFYTSIYTFIATFAVCLLYLTDISMDKPMQRKFDYPKLVIASHNQGKVREIGELLAPFGVETISVGDLDLPEPVEDGKTFIANAEIKALAAANASGLPALADDSGLAVDALGGAPGIYSARYAGPTKDFSAAMERIHSEIGDGERGAHFVCALTLAWPATENSPAHTESFEGKVFGQITWPMRGEKGFGYDPVFIPTGHDVTFAEMDPADKHAMSHRANAFKQLIAACFKG